MPEHVAVVEIVIAHEQLTGESRVVEVVGEIAHLPFKVVAIIDELPGVVLLGVVLAQMENPGYDDP